jgi:hypothetical protein
MNAADIKQDFDDVWDDFAASLDDFYDRAAERALMEDGPSLHETFRACYWVPKEGLQRVLRRTEDEQVNVGSATGLFFEQMAASLIERALQKRIPNLIVERNQTDHPELRDVRNQPDLVIRHAGTDRAVVFEFKAAPKRNDLNGVRGQRQEFNASPVPLQFYLVGGYVAFDKSDLQSYISEGWATFLKSSDRNQEVIENGPTLDDFVRDAARYLEG